MNIINKKWGKNIEKSVFIAFFNNITYFIGHSKELIRIESRDEFKESERVSDDFLNNAFIDSLLEDVEYFDLKNMEINYNFIIKQFEKDRVFYNIYKLR